MERKTRNSTAVPSLKEKTKENNQTQNYDILNPNVFQNISKCFPKLLAEVFTARLQHHQSLRHWVVASQSIAACTEEMAGDDFCNKRQNTPKTLVQKTAFQSEKTASAFSVGHLQMWWNSIATWAFKKSQSMHMARCPHLHGRLLSLF